MARPTYFCRKQVQMPTSHVCKLCQQNVTIAPVKSRMRFVTRKHPGETPCAGSTKPLPYKEIKGPR